MRFTDQFFYLISRMRAVKIKRCLFFLFFTSWAVEECFCVGLGHELRADRVFSLGFCATLIPCAVLQLAIDGSVCRSAGPGRKGCRVTLFRSCGGWVARTALCFGLKGLCAGLPSAWRTGAHGEEWRTRAGCYTYRLC